MLLVIASNSDKLSIGVNINMILNDLELPK